MKIKFKFLFALAVVFFCSSFSPKVYAQDNKSADKIESSIAFEQALKNYELLKQKEQEELILKLNLALTQIVETWIAAAKIKQEGVLGSRLEQSWEKLSLIQPIAPIHYEYYLRGYKYSLIKTDLTKSNSMVDPYKAMLIIKEDLYVEKNHPANVSDLNLYFYTVSINHTLDLEYKNEKFNLVSSTAQVVSIENNCPDEIKKQRL